MARVLRRLAPSPHEALKVKPKGRIVGWHSVKVCEGITLNFWKSNISIDLKCLELLYCAYQVNVSILYIAMRMTKINSSIREGKHQTILCFVSQIIHRHFAAGLKNGQT